MFECYDADKKCYSTMFDTAYDNVEKHMVTEGCYVKVYDDLGELSWTLKSEDDLIMFRECIARAATWKQPVHSTEYVREKLGLPPLVRDHINPSHYQDYMPDMQWLEAMQYLPRFRDNPEAFKGAIELQIRKYLDRNGGKDEELQELSKALWYMKFLVAYTKEGKPIKIEAIDKILGE
jgi:hypothetical protein